MIRNGLFIAETVPGAELYAIKGGTQAIFVTHADQVFSPLLTFVGAHGKDTTVQ